MGDATRNMTPYFIFAGTLYDIQSYKQHRNRKTIPMMGLKRNASHHGAQLTAFKPSGEMGHLHDDTERSERVRVTRQVRVSRAKLLDEVNESVRALIWAFTLHGPGKVKPNSSYDT